MTDDLTDPGPHTCVYVGTDQGDECTICGALAIQFPESDDAMNIDWDGRDDRREFDGPEYDYEGGGGA